MLALEVDRELREFVTDNVDRRHSSSTPVFEAASDETAARRREA
ncbi:MAG: hypothetical protein ACHREM_05735 [Polyangiales bacterium]